MAPHYKVAGTIEAPAGLGAVEEFALLKAMAPDAVLKVAIPGPLTFIQAIELNGHSRDAVLDRLAAIVRSEVSALVEAGAPLVQIDEPGLPRAPHGLSFAEGADAIGRCLEAVAAQSIVHVCFRQQCRPAVRRPPHRADVGRHRVAALRCTDVRIRQPGDGGTGTRGVAGRQILPSRPA